MKIEKISDTQVKFILSKSQLEEHNIKMTELAYGSEKTHRLFQEMMRQAHEECDFKVDNTPLMVEVMPVGTNHVVIVVTKISTELENGFLKHNCLVSGGYKTNDLDLATTYEIDNLAIFSFDSLDDVVLAAKRLQDIFMGQSRLYKCNSRYFLVIQEELDYALAEAELALHEYGIRHISNDLSETYLIEHGEFMIEQQAVEKLSWHL